MNKYVRSYLLLLLASISIVINENMIGLRYAYLLALIVLVVLIVPSGTSTIVLAGIPFARFILYTLDL